MAERTWTLTDVRQDVYVEQITLGPDEVGGGASGYSVIKRTLRSGLSQGVDVIEVNNGRFGFVVVPTRGMGIWKAGMSDMKLGWNSPINGPVHPSLVRLWEPSGIGWLDGFDELLVRCGLESNGAPEFNDDGSLRYPLHGRVANIPAHKVEVAIDGDSGEIRITGLVDETRLFGNKLRMTSTISTRIGQPGLTVTDTISNPSAEPSELELLYHVNFGKPLLEPGAKVVLPAAKVAPRNNVAVSDVPTWDAYGPETPGSIESVFFVELNAQENGRTQTLLRNAVGDRGVSLKFDTSQLPYFTLWKNRQADSDGYVTGLEPGINFPNPKSFEKQQGRVAIIEPGQSRQFEVTLEVHPDTESVLAAGQTIDKIQQGKTPVVLEQPDPEWSIG